MKECKKNPLFSAWLHSLLISHILSTRSTRACTPAGRYRKPLAFFILLAAFFVLSSAAHSQEQDLRWGKWSKGQQTGNTMRDKVVDSYVDSAGNTYIFGRFGMDARLGGNGPKICPMDTCAVEMGYMIGNSRGVFLAKIDSLGNILWCKSARNGSQNSGCRSWDNMVVKDNKIRFIR